MGKYFNKMGVGTLLLNIFCVQFERFVYYFSNIKCDFLNLNRRSIWFH